jgi:hypothetical protein
MFEAIIKAKSKNDLKLLGKRRIDFKGNSAVYDKKDFMFRVDAIISDQDKKRLESEGYIVEIVSDLSMVTEERSREVSKTNRFSDIDLLLMQFLKINSNFCWFYRIFSFNLQQIEHWYYKINLI